MSSLASLLTNNSVALLLVATCLQASADSGCDSIASPTPADYSPDKGERSNLKVLDGDKVCGQVIYFDKKQLRLSEDTLLYVGRYEGEIKNSAPNGKGAFFNFQNERYVGFFVDGLPHGQYVKYDNGENVLESGMYDKGKRTGTISYYFGNNFVGGIRGQVTFADDKIADGPTTLNEVNYRTGVMKRTFVGKYVNGLKEGEWRDAVTIRLTRHHPIVLIEDLFGTEDLNLDQINERDYILNSLRDANVTIYDDTGYYVSPTADVTPAFLDKVIRPDLKKYIPKLSTALTRYQKPYTDTRVTTGKEAYVILNNSQVTYASYDVDKDQLYGEAISTFMNGDSYIGKLNAKGTNFEGEITLMLADGSKLVGQFSQEQGYISGPAKYTFKDKTKNNETVTKNVTVINGEWKYQTKAQENYSKTSKRISRAWKDLFHNGNVFDKFANLGIHSLNVAAYPFAWAMMKYDIDTIGVSYNSDKGFGIIISKDGIGDWNLTISDLMQIAVLLEEKGEEKAAMRFKFKASMIIENPDLYSYAIESNIKHKRGAANPLLKKATILPVASKQGAYFSSMNRISPDDAYEQFFNQRLAGEYDWTPDQKESLASTLFDKYKLDIDADKLVNQMKDEALGEGLKHFMTPETINSTMRGYGNDIQASLMVECINWTINRWKTHDLDPKIRFQLYALMSAAKYTYDRTIWANWFGSDKAPQFSGRQQIIFSEALRAMREFEEDLTRTGKTKNDYKVPQIPFKY